MPRQPHEPAHAFETRPPLCNHMRMSILRLLKRNAVEISKPSTETEAVRKIIQSLDEMDPDRAKFIAAFAYLLGRVARADMHISPEETNMMEKIVMERAALPENQSVMVIQLAKTQNVLFGGTENFLVSREFNSIASHEEKMGLLDCLYAVAAADHSISTVEANEISQIADELRIEHRDLISIRSRYRDQLAVLKNSRTP
jgi:uncharacterized tellurite resistance protein B-like protein